MEIARQPPREAGVALGVPLASSHGDDSAQSYLALGWMPLWVKPRWEGMGKTTLRILHFFLMGPPLLLFRVRFLGVKGHCLTTAPNSVHEDWTTSLL